MPKRKEIREDLEYAKMGISKRKKEAEWNQAAQDFVDAVNEDKKKKPRRLEDVDDEMLDHLGVK